MPTVNPRVNVTLAPSTDALVSRLAGLQGVSKSQVLRELLEAAEPALQRVAALMEAAASSKGAVLDGLARSLEQAQDKVETQLQEHLSMVDSTVSDLVNEAQAVRGRRPASSAQRAGGAAPGGAAVPISGGSTPGPVTRGSGGPLKARGGR